ncbi:MAG: NAAT family transporter [Campylobacteraceae bacterium]|nr:NAAT family transporter [Campylobacteraceae bacterium]
MDNSFSIISTAILIFFILDPFGNVPLLLSILKNVDKEKHRKVIIREVLIGLVILLTFLFFGDQFLSIFHLETQAITIAGGIIFFVIALKMIFPDPSGESMFSVKRDEDPLVVPIAMPMIAGPAALATLLVLAKTNSDHTGELFVSLLIGWGLSSLVLILSPFLYKVLKTKGLTALERLMGMLLLMMAVQMFIDGIRNLLPTFNL